MVAVHVNGFRAGPVIGFQGGRDQSEDSHLNGLGDIPPSLTAGVFATYRDGPFRFSATVRQAITHTGNGLIGLVQFDFLQPMLDRKLLFSAGPSLQFANGESQQTWFGVSPSQSEQSGLAPYSASAGLRDVGIHANLSYLYSPHVILRSFVNVTEITGSAAQSPIVQSKTQATIGIGAAYHF
jgi:outer membrane scaffolding protein for murein synthesis (MipA/OmpV family)